MDVATVENPIGLQRLAPSRRRQARLRSAPVRDAVGIQPGNKSGPTQHALDYDIFVNVPSLDPQDDKKVQRLYKAKDFDFRLKPGSTAIDPPAILHTFPHDLSTHS